ncbi:hypothetical protein PPL_07488 [Heterostelium album PN500]|uniref:B box-type domain-containing protein n=1 Tax=Heterostelium pallidum (strain ATCC 26659 / Pp 5 / PN500) TaxID=670386 RepID=D3BG37_HETP5|nr:hypothetical protein PPL_07488 [Heterostelium album PN500]EFA79629.1 hypothetical protein PPL_07488 [Heterostelium album PN500]|eukprot:XP_020431750.1 hypothetical protein PPL_07488 [Heterostelium album PN500]
MDSKVSKNNDFKCSDHKRVLELVCHECNKLLCSRCSANHIKDMEHSTFVYHIDDIRLGLNQVLNNNSNSSNNNNNDTNSTYHFKYISQRLDDIWKTIKSSTAKYSELDSKEKQISKHFEELHLYLMSEEKKIKTLIIDDKEIIINQIENNINELKYLINIIKLNNSYDRSTSNTSSSSSSSDNIDTTTSYSIPSIMESIDTNQTLSSFIKSNNETIFYCTLSYNININSANSNYSIQDILLNYDNNTDSMILDLIYNYNNQFKSFSSLSTTTIINNINNKYYHLIIDKFDFTKLHKLLKQSIRFDLYPYDSQSITIGENIYIFGSYFIEAKCCVYSIRHQTYHVHTIKDIDDVFSAIDKACYDGQDHIYLILGRSIYRFNIRTLQCELYQSEALNFPKAITALYDNGYLYIISQYEFEMSIININRKTMENWKSDQQCEWISACTDGNRHIYLHSKHNRFIRFNILTKEIKNLKTMVKRSNNTRSMVYHRVSEKESYIYNIGGNKGSGRYSIEKDQWQFILYGDEYDRSHCSATIFEIDK